MDFEFTPEQEMLRDATRRLLADQCSAEHLRQLPQSDQSYDAGLWDSMAELGLLAAAIPEEYGGVGLGETDLCVIAEELGRVVAPVPFFSSICLAAEAIRIAGSDEQKSKWLPKLASGEMIASFAIAEQAAPIDLQQLRVNLVDGKLYGEKMPVPEAGIASLLVVAASHAGQPCLVLAELEQPGVEVEEIEFFDQLRTHYRVAFDGVKSQVLPGSTSVQVLNDFHQRAVVYCAFEQIGGAEACLYMGRDYVLERQMFGRSLGSYQAIKHKLADVYTELEIARSNAFFACWALEAGSPEFPMAAYTARLSAIDAYQRAARENLQVHGGIGYTIEADCHFHYRRERLLALNLGSTEACVDNLVAELIRDVESERVA